MISVHKYRSDKLDDELNLLSADVRLTEHLGVKIPIHRYVAITQNHVIFASFKLGLYES